MSDDGIHIVYVESGGICPVCGNGLWPGQPPCKHREKTAPSPVEPLDREQSE